MQIKIRDVTLNEWENADTQPGSIQRTGNRRALWINQDYLYIQVQIYPTAVSVSEDGEINSIKYGVEFWDKLFFLRDLYCCPKYFDSLELAKEYTDNFLIRMSTMKAFW